MTGSLIEELRSIIGRRHVITGERAARSYATGYRFGAGPVLAVVRPGTLVEQWKVVKSCVAANVAIILQAANTGLTGGSTPAGDDYDRPVVLINVMRINRIDLLGDGSEALCLPGVRLDQLEKKLATIGREPHSVIGSSCLGASVVGGVCNSSGGSLVRRGPAYTQLALYARVDANGVLELVNHLGINLGEDAETVLGRLDAADYRCDDVRGQGDAWGSDRAYRKHVRDVSAQTPARFNADPRRLHEASGSAGKLVVFALRVDTFPAQQERVFYVGVGRPDELQQIRRDILQDFASLPIAAEYMHSQAYGLSQRYGKDLQLFIRIFGSRMVPRAYEWKSRIDNLVERIGLGRSLSDRLLQRIGRLAPDLMPACLNDYRDRYEHHLMIRTSEDGADELRDYLSSRFPNDQGEFLECSASEGKAAFLNRFAAGAAVVRYRAIHRHEVEDIVALDIALPRNATDWFEELPPDVAAKIVAVSYVGHFLCHVLHQEYLVRKGEDCAALEHELLGRLEARGAEFPAEHNVGHLYAAKPALADFYRKLDPRNVFNPGIGKTSKRKDWGVSAPTPRLRSGEADEHGGCCSSTVERPRRVVQH